MKQKSLIGRKRQEKEVSNRVGCFSQGHFPFLGDGGGVGVYQADDFINADHIILDRLVEGHIPKRG